MGGVWGGSEVVVYRRRVEDGCSAGSNRYRPGGGKHAENVWISTDTSSTRQSPDANGVEDEHTLSANAQT